MRKLALLSVGLLSTYACAFAASEVTVTLSPDPNVQYETLPTSFTMTFNGVDKVEKSSPIASNQIKFIAPSGDAQQITGTISGNVVTYNMPANPNIELDESGVYKCELVADKFKWTDEDNNVVKNQAQQWEYNVTGNGGGGDIDNTVKYDLTASFNPQLQPVFNLEEERFETLQVIINAGEVNAKEDALVTITGPGYYVTSHLSFAMGTKTVTWLRADFVSGPVYNGKYTLTIPKGSFGTPSWFEDPETGRANDDIIIEFEVIGGIPASEMTADTSLGTTYNPSINTKVKNLRKVTITFSEPVVFDETATVNVGQLPDLSNEKYDEYGTASFERISDNEVKVVFEKNVNIFGQYIMYIPAGFFHTPDFDPTNGTGKCTPAQNPSWIVVPDAVYVEVVSTVPENESVLKELPTGYDIIVYTSNDEEVKSMTFSLLEFKMNDEAELPVTILDNITTKEKNAEKAIIWKNTGEPIILREGYYYEIQYNLYNADGIDIADGIISVNGQSKTGIDEITLDNTGEEIYNLNGFRMNKSGEKLPAGIYIVNGKKVVIR